MGKSIRSKIKKRLRTAKRQRVDAMIVTPRENEHNAALNRVIQGRAIKLGKAKNAFKYPESEDAFFPQHEVVKPIDFRAQSMPMVGYTFRGNRRKYDPEQAAFLAELSKTHPEMKTLSGGGAVHAKTGRKVSRKEAELLATSVQLPEMSALAQEEAADVAAKASASTNGRPAEDDSDMEDAPGSEPVPEGAADHTRRPVLKDHLKEKRKAEHRPRPKTVSSKGGKRITNEDVQAALQAATPRKPAAAEPAPPAAAAGATPPSAAKKRITKKGGGTPNDKQGDKMEA